MRSFHPHDIPWERLELPGVHIRVLAERHQPMAHWLLIDIAAGAALPRHMHSHAREWTYVLSGQLRGPSGEVIGAGQAWEVDPGSTHGPVTAEVRSTLLSVFLGPLDFLQQ